MTTRPFLHEITCVICGATAWRRTARFQVCHTVKCAIENQRRKQHERNVVNYAKKKAAKVERAPLPRGNKAGTRLGPREPAALALGQYTDEQLRDAATRAVAWEEAGPDHD